MVSLVTDPPASAASITRLMRQFAVLLNVVASTLGRLLAGISGTQQDFASFRDRDEASHHAVSVVDRGKQTVKRTRHEKAAECADNSEEIPGILSWI
jgi:hypothetical protein